MHSVFISYAQQDSGSAAGVCEATERRGIRCWLAPRDIRPGENWPQAIQNALHEAAAIVVLVSVHALGSPHVERELTQAVSYRKLIVPYRLDSAPIKGAFAYLLSTVQWVDAGADYDLLATQLGRILAGGKAPVIVSRPRKKTSTAPDLNSLDELTRDRGRFSIKNAIGKIFDDR